MLASRNFHTYHDRLTLLIERVRPIGVYGRDPTAARTAARVRAGQNRAPVPVYGNVPHHAAHGVV
jgi:hypothetical protein